MKTYCIKPGPISGTTSYFEIDDTSTSVWNGEKAAFCVAVNIDINFDYPLLFDAAGHYCFHEDLIEILNNEGITCSAFRKVDKFLRDSGDEQKDFPHNPYYVLLKSTNSFKFSELCDESLRGIDVFRCRATLFVSERALGILNRENAFQDFIEGKGYGKEFEILSNRIEVIGELDEFVMNSLTKWHQQVSLARKRIVAEWRKGQGLPPLP